MIEFILNNKPVLVGLHLGFAILGIDLLLWLLGELAANVKSNKRMKWVGLGAVISFVLSWFIGGYYYVKFYGNLVKPVIKASSAPWAHNIVMESKEHIFLFIVPLTIVVALLAFSNVDYLKEQGLKKPFTLLVAIVAALSLLIGLMGFIISASARWA